MSGLSGAASGRPVGAEVEDLAASRDGRTKRVVPHSRVRRPCAGSLGALAIFVALAYALSWAWMTPFSLAGDVVEKGAGWPTHFVALFGPMAAALVVSAWVSGRAGPSKLVMGMVKWRIPLRWWIATVSPVLFMAAALVVAAASGGLPAWDDLDRFSGLPMLGVVPVTALVIVGALGEESGWRGFALPLLQRRHGALAAALLVTPIWAAWHLLFFLTISSYRDFAPPAYVGFVFALGCGSIVLTWLYNGTGGSILACAIWHGLFNMTTATVAASGTVAAVTSALVIFQAIVLIHFELRARRRGDALVLGPRVGLTDQGTEASPTLR
jgi:membrane protease YdiL (CAAX protease family)